MLKSEKIHSQWATPPAVRSHVQVLTSPSLLQTTTRYFSVPDKPQISGTKTQVHRLVWDLTEEQF